ncbi:hypothetical protein DFH08DRAFT_1045769 [Mycena albidolilacea]|uniref:Uncharacterized protein n=1 Tax=Mycena albidolilacea TaxID=1033008 RepID=A0AAD6Z7J3_9AGAR|nr:hypothetical protein DFH08DRAFT_1045769 [Mycena albidolilacea]
MRNSRLKFSVAASFLPRSATMDDIRLVASVAAGALLAFRDSLSPLSFVNANPDQSTISVKLEPSQASVSIRPQEPRVKTEDSDPPDPSNSLDHNDSDDEPGDLASVALSTTFWGDANIICGTEPTVAQVACRYATVARHCREWHNSSMLADESESESESLGTLRSDIIPILSRPHAHGPWSGQRPLKKNTCLIFIPSPLSHHPAFQQWSSTFPNQCGACLGFKMVCPGCKLQVEGLRKRHQDRENISSRKFLSVQNTLLKIPQAPLIAQNGVAGSTPIAFSIRDKIKIQDYATATSIPTDAGKNSHLAAIIAYDEETVSSSGLYLSKNRSVLVIVLPSAHAIIPCLSHGTAYPARFGKTPCPLRDFCRALKWC